MIKKMIEQIEIFEKPLQIGHYKCIVCDNVELARGWDNEKGEWIYLNKLHKITIGMNWIFFCNQCYYQLVQQIKGEKTVNG